MWIPEELWSFLYADHWGPIQEGKYILVLADGLKFYLEGVIVKRNIHRRQYIQAFLEIFSRHGIPRKIRRQLTTIQWQ